MRKAIMLVPAFLVAAVLSGCSFDSPSPVDQSTVSIGENGVSVETSGAKVKVGDGVEVNTGNVHIQTGDDGTDSREISAPTGKAMALVFDVSGSMGAKLNGETKIAIAKRSAGQLIAKMGADDGLSVVVYGHIGSSSQVDKERSCRGIEEVYTYGAVNAGAALSKINPLEAKGWTPIAASLQRAGDILLAHSEAESRKILLVSDGQETCGGDPIAVAKDLCARGVRVDVIGFDVSGSDAKQLQMVSAQCGAYASVKSAKEFETVIEEGNISIVAPGSVVEVHNGNVKIDTDSAKIDVNSDGVKVDTDALKLKNGAAGTDIKINVPGL